MKTLIALDQKELLVKVTLIEKYVDENSSIYSANLSKRLLLLGYVDSFYGFLKLPVVDLDVAENYFREIPLADFSILSPDDFRDENTTFYFMAPRENSVSPYGLPPVEPPIVVPPIQPPVLVPPIQPPMTTPIQPPMTTPIQPPMTTPSQPPMTTPIQPPVVIIPSYYKAVHSLSDFVMDYVTFVDYLGYSHTLVLTQNDDLSTNPCQLIDGNVLNSYGAVLCNPILGGYYKAIHPLGHSGDDTVTVQDLNGNQSVYVLTRTDDPSTNPCEYVEGNVVNSTGAITCQP